MGFLSGGYSAPHDHPHSGPYNVEGGMFGGGNPGGFGNLSGQPSFGYGFHGNGDYNTWGQPRKQYDDYYRDSMYGDERGMKMMEHGMSGLSLGDKDQGGSKAKSWANVASQPAKQPSLLKKKAGMPPPPIMLSTWDTKNGTVAKAPIAAPVQAPRPPAWERMDRPSAMPPSMPSGPASLPPHQTGPSVPTGPIGPLMGGSGPGRGGFQQHQQQMGYNMPPPSQMHPPATQQSHSQSVSNKSNHAAPPPAVRSQNQSLTTNSRNSEVQPPSQPPQPQYPDEARMKSEYNPTHFDLNPESARFFVIKSYSEDDIHRSIKYEIWCSTDHGNKRLDQSFRESKGKGPIYLLFSVNSSGHFCGMAQMMSEVDYDSSSSVWSQNKWRGQFKVKWTYVKDVPNSALRHIRLENNENKPVTNSRDTQEVPFEKGKQVLKIIHTFPHTTSIFDDFIHYEKRQEEEDQRRTTGSGGPPGGRDSERDRNERGGHHGGGGPMPPSNGRDSRDYHNLDRDNHRDNGRGHPPGSGFGRVDRNDFRGEMRGGGGPGARGHYGGGGPGRAGMGGGERDRGDFDFNPRDRDQRGRGGGRPFRP